MSVDPAEVLRIAALARLELDENDLERLTADLNAILGHVDALSELEEPAAEGCVDLGPQPSTRLEEASAEGLSVDPAAMAPAWNDGFFLVPHPPGVQASGGGA